MSDAPSPVTPSSDPMVVDLGGGVIADAVTSLPVAPPAGGAYPEASPPAGAVGVPGAPAPPVPPGEEPRLETDDGVPC